MASIVERPKSDGTITYQVKWREGGGRTDAGQSERFADPDSADADVPTLVELGVLEPPPPVAGRSRARNRRPTPAGSNRC